MLKVRIMVPTVSGSCVRYCFTAKSCPGFCWLFLGNLRHLKTTELAPSPQLEQNGYQSFQGLRRNLKMTPSFEEFAFDSRCPQYPQNP